MLRLEESNIDVLHGWRLAQVQGDTITCISAYSGAEKSFSGFDSVVIVAGSAPQADLYYTLKENYPFEHVYVTGAAWLPRKIAEATQGGATLGMAI